MYTIERFGSITLPIYNPTYTLSPVPARLNFIDTTAGVFDNDGDARNQPALPFPVSYTAIVSESVYAANRATLDALRAAVGTQARLYRRANDDNTLHYCLARLAAKPHERPYTKRGYFEITLDFQQKSLWQGATHGTGWKLDTGIKLDDGRTLDELPPTVLASNPTILTLVNNGNLPCDDVRVIITAGSDDIDHVYLSNELIELRWTGTLLEGTSLEIDSGAFSVLNAGSNAYDGLTLQPDHSIAGLLQIQPGANFLAVYFGGGGTDSTIAIIFNDRWA